MGHRVIYGGGAQTLRHVPIDRRCSPAAVASATFAVIDAIEGETSAAREVVAEVAATLDAATEALTAAAGRNAADPHAIPIASNTGFVEGRRYLLQTADGGDREVVTLRRVASNALYTARPILGVYATSDVVRGVEISGSFPALVADDLDRAIRQGRDYYAIWGYTIDGQAYVVREPVPVERYSVGAWIGEEELLVGQWSLRSRVDPLEVQEALRAATAEVTGELEAATVDITQVRVTEMGRQAVRFLGLALLYEDRRGERDVDLGATYRQRFDNMMLRITNGRNYGAKVLDREDDQAVDQGDLLDKFVIG